MELTPFALQAKIPRLGETVDKADPMVWVRLFNPLSGWSWYLIELEPFATNAICYVYEVGWDERLTYFNLADIDRHAVEVGEPNQLDTFFTPCRLSAVKAGRQSLAPRFPLGRVVATAGALAAFQRTRQSPLDFLKRHTQGDWGELDDHDRAENEFSLQHRFRLLSRYTLRDDTVIYVITEADRSATTLLLPQEY